MGGGCEADRPALACVCDLAVVDDEEASARAASSPGGDGGLSTTASPRGPGRRGSSSSGCLGVGGSAACGTGGSEAMDCSSGGSMDEADASLCVAVGNGESEIGISSALTKDFGLIT